MQSIKNLFKEHLLVVLFLTILAFFCFASLATFFKSRDSRFFGNVREVSATSITIVDPKVGIREFSITKRTRTHFDKSTNTDLTVGRDVFIFARKGEALDIRVLEPKF